LDLDAVHHPTDLARLLSNADRIFWFAPRDAESAVRCMRTLLNTEPGWSQKICIVWVLNSETKFAPYLPELASFAVRDIKVSFQAPGSGRGKLLNQGMERIVRYLRGLQIGLALGGGVARG